MNRKFLLLPAAAVALIWLTIGRKSPDAINPESGAKRPPSIGINPADFEISDAQYSNIKADCTEWTAKQFATFARLRKVLDAENWPDHRLARRISMDDLDNPDYLNAMLASDKAAKGKHRYALPREKGLHYAQTQNTPLAYIMAAYANGADKKDRVFDPTLIEQAIAAYGELPELLYAKLMGNKSYQNDLESIRKLSEKIPEIATPYLLEGLYWKAKNQNEKAWDAFRKASDKPFSNFGMDVLNQELQYRLSQGEDIRDVLRAGSRISGVSETSLFQQLDAELGHMAYQNRPQINSNWDLLAVYGISVSESAQNNPFIQLQYDALDRQIELARMIHDGGKWSQYYSEPYDQLQAELTAQYDTVRQYRDNLTKFIDSASDAELHAYAKLRATDGERAALDSISAARGQ